MPDVLRLTCRDFYRHADLLSRAGIDEEAFRPHDPASLDPDDKEDRCFCYDGGGDPNGRDAENRREANRRCAAPVTIARPGFVVVACCRCYDRSGADDDKLAEAGRLVARTMRKVARAEEELPKVADRTVAELKASRLLLRAGYTTEQVNRAGRVLRGEA